MILEKYDAVLRRGFERCKWNRPSGRYPEGL